MSKLRKLFSLVLTTVLVLTAWLVAPAAQPVMAAPLVDLILVPATPTVTVGDTFDVTVEVQAGASGVDGVEIYLDFDSTYLEFQSWTLPTVNNYEAAMLDTTSTPGEADYARATFGTPPSGTFDFVIITFKALAATASTPIDFHRVSPRDTFTYVGVENGLDTTTGANVTIPQLVSIAVTPVNPSIALGLTQQFTATGTYSDNSTVNITTSANWTSDNTSVATISATGLATSHAEGTTVITATSGNITSPGVTLTVTAAELISIAVSPPPNPTIPVTVTVTVDSTSQQPWHDTGLDVLSGDQIMIIASGQVTYAPTSPPTGPDGTSNLGGASYLVLDTSVPGQSLVGNIAPSNSYFDGKGFFVGSSFQRQVPITNATAQAGNLYLGFNDGFIAGGRTSMNQGGLGDNNGSFTVTVTVWRGPSIVLGKTQQFTATGTYSNNSTADITTSANWTSDNTTVATIDTTGLTTGVAEGTTTIIATSDAISGNATLMVTALVPPSMTTDGASNIAGTYATLGGTLSSLGTALSANVSFQWGLNSGNYTDETSPVSMNTTGTFSANLTRLDPGTLYYFRARAVGDGTSYGGEGSFATSPPPLLRKWGVSGSGDGQFDYPISVAADPAGNVYVADYYNHRIQKFTSSGEFITKWGVYGSGDGQFRYPRDVAVDSEGNVYVADRSNHRIQKFTSSGQFITKWGGTSYGSGDGQFYYPRGVAVDSEGNVYVVDTNNHRIQKFTSFGGFLTKWGTSYGSGDGQFYYPRGVAVDSEGNVYVSDYQNHRIQKFTSSGQFITKWGVYGSGDGQFYYPRGITVDSLDNVYVVDTDNHRIQKFTSSGQFITKWGAYGSSDGQFYTPRGVAVDSEGNVYVADTGNYRIQVFGAPATPIVITSDSTNMTTDSAILNGELRWPGISATANVSFQWGLNSGNYTEETSPQVMTAPSAVFSANLTGLGAGTTYYFRAKAVGEGTSYGEEKRFTTREPPLQFLLQWGSSGSGNGQFNGPAGVAIDSSGNVYVADTDNDRIQKFTSSGQFITNWGTSGSGDGQFNYPWGVAVDSSGNVYVADGGNHRIQKFTSSGEFLTKWGYFGSGNGQFNAPGAVAVDSSGNVYVADYNNQRIQQFTSSGQFITKWGSSGSGDGQFNTPRGVTVDSAGNVYVADHSNHRIQKFTSSGQFIAKWGSSGSGDGQFNSPWGVAVDSAGNVYVADHSNHRIQKFTSSGAFLASWGSIGSGDGQLNWPQSVAIDSTGNVYVADFNNNRIQAFGVPPGVVTTNSATNVTAISAILNGTLNSLGTALSANVSFQWGTSSGNYTNETPSLSTNTTGPFSATLAGLNPGTLYYFRAKAVSDNTSYGMERSFIASGPASKVTTNSATNVTASSAMLNGVLSSLGTALSANVSFQWGLSSGNYTSEAPSLSMNATGAFSATLAGLNPGTLYYFRAKAVGDDTSHGVERSFVTSPPSLLDKWGAYGSSDGQFRYPRGVAVDSAGNVYVADTDNNRIQKFTSSGQFLIKWGAYGSSDGQFRYPRGVAVDSLGNVYVADSDNDRIQKFTSFGGFLTKWGAYGSGDGQFNYPKGVAVDSAGNVYVTDYYNHRIQKFTSSGQLITKWGVYGSSDGQFQYPYGITVDLSGNVYVADRNNHRIQKFTSLGQFITKWGANGDGDGQFYYPRGVTVDSDGNVYVADSDNNRIQKFTSSGQFITRWGDYGNGDGQFEYPRGIAVDSDGNVYVTDYYNHRIQVFGVLTTLMVSTSDATNITTNSASLNGELQSPGISGTANVSFQWGLSSGNYTEETTPQAIMAPGGFSANLSGLSQATTYYFRAKAVADGTSYGEEREFRTREPSPPFLLKWGSSGSGDGQFNGPTGVAIDSLGNVYIADYNNHRIQKFNSSGQFLTRWGSLGSDDGQFNYPWGVAVDSSGNVYVADGGNHRIQKFTSSGQFITSWGSLGSGWGQFSAPGAVAVDSSGNVYVADGGNHRIQKFNSLGQYLTKWGYLGSSNGYFNTPRGVAVDSSGNVYVADYSNHRIQKFTSSGGFIAKWGSSGSGDGQFNYPWGVAVDSSGDIYVVDGANHRIQKFTSSGQLIADWGSLGSGDGQFNWPQGVAVDSSGNVYVADFNNNRIQAFGVPVPLAVATNNATFITSTSASLKGGLSLGTTASANVSFEWGTSSGNYTEETTSQVITASDAFSANLSGLSPGTSYYFRAKAVGSGTSYGMERSFATFAADALIVTTDDATNITGNSARLGGTLVNLGLAISANVSFEWGLSSGNYTETAPQVMTVPGAFSANLSGLSPGTTYYFQAKAVSNPVAYGGEKSFTSASTVVINAPGTVGADGDFTVTVNISQVVDLNGTQYDISFDSSVLALEDVTPGQIDSTEMPVQGFAWIDYGTYRVVQSLMFDTVNGTGYLAVLHFHVIGSLGDSSSIDISNGILSGMGAEIPAAWIGGSVEVTVIPGDADSNGIVNILDLTKIVRIILMIDDETPGADANLDGVVNILDLTKIVRIILMLD